MKRNAMIALMIILCLTLGAVAQNKIDLANMVTGILGVTNGGLGASGTPYSLDLITTGLVAGNIPVVRETSGTYTVDYTYPQLIVYNENATAAAAFSLPLPDAISGMTVCVKNSDDAGTADTGIITISVGSGQYIHINGHRTAGTGDSIASGGVAGDSGCMVGKSTTDWEFYAQLGTWTPSS